MIRQYIIKLRKLSLQDVADAKIEMVSYSD